MNQTFYAQVIDGVVTAVHCVTYEFIVANPDRYGDPALWIEAFYDNSGRGYCGVGWTYDSVNDKFVAPPPLQIDNE